MDAWTPAYPGLTPTPGEGGPGAWSAPDDAVRMVVHLPPGSGPGPLVTPTLGAWGAKSAPAYTALLNLHYRWFDVGVTRAFRSPFL